MPLLRMLLVSAICSVASTIEACSNPQPQPPTVNPPSTIEMITGTERLGWDQRAADAVELATIRYVAYVDGARTQLMDVTCSSGGTSDGFACSARLPTMTRGNHTIELAAFVQDGGLLESARSAALRVTVVAGTPLTATPVRGAEWPSSASRVADGLDRPTDIAFTPDGRLLVAEKRGRIRIIRDGALVSEPAIVLFADGESQGALLALAVDPQFVRTHHVFAIYTSRPRAGGRAFVLARFREARDTLGDRVASERGLERARLDPRDPSRILGSESLLADVPVGAVAVAPDGTIYFATADAIGMLSRPK